jgi:hypothetical protein
MLRIPHCPDNRLTDGGKVVPTVFVGFPWAGGQTEVIGTRYNVKSSHTDREKRIIISGGGKYAHTISLYR